MRGQHRRLSLLWPSGGMVAPLVSHAAGLSGGPAFRPLGSWDGRANILLSHLCVLQDVDIDEERLFMFPHAPQQESTFF